MKKTLLTLLIALPFYLATKAQQDTRVPLRTPEYEAERVIEVMQRELNLTEAQIDTIYKIHLKYAVLRRETMTKEEFREQMKRMKAEIQRVLTPEQFEILNSQTVRNQNKAFNTTRQIRQEETRKDSLETVNNE